MDLLKELFLIFTGLPERTITVLSEWQLSKAPPFLHTTWQINDTQGTASIEGV